MAHISNREGSPIRLCEEHVDCSERQRQHSALATQGEHASSLVQWGMQGTHRGVRPQHMLQGAAGVVRLAQVPDETDALRERRGARRLRRLEGQHLAHGHPWVAAPGQQGRQCTPLRSGHALSRLWATLGLPHACRAQAGTLLPYSRLMMLDILASPLKASNLGKRCSPRFMWSAHV